MWEKPCVKCPENTVLLYSSHLGRGGKEERGEGGREDGGGKI